MCNTTSSDQSDGKTINACRDHRLSFDTKTVVAISAGAGGTVFIISFIVVHMVLHQRKKKEPIRHAFTERVERENREVYGMQNAAFVCEKIKVAS